MTSSVKLTLGGRVYNPPITVGTEGERAIGIPTEMFAVFFAIGRMPGWIANFKEIRDEGKTRIYRSRRIYTGPALTLCDSMESRS